MNHNICGNCCQFASLTGCEKFPDLKARFPTPSCHVFEPLWMNFPEGTQTREEQIAFLRGELPGLQKNPNLTIYFGADAFFKEHVVDKPGLGIRFMKTAGGEQYRLFMINMFGQEHASSYYHDIEDLISSAIVAAGRYMRPLRSNIEFLKNRVATKYNGWYSRNNAATFEGASAAMMTIQAAARTNQAIDHIDQMFPDAKTIVLDAPK